MEDPFGDLSIQEETTTEPDLVVVDDIVSEESWGLSEADEIRRRVLDSMSNAKRSQIETEELERLNIEAEKRARAEVLYALVLWNLEFSKDPYNTQSREEQAETQAKLDVVKLMGSAVQPQMAEKAYMRVSSALVETSAILRDAQSRADRLHARYDALAAKYAALSPADSQWRVDMGARDVLAPLNKEVSAAKSHVTRLQSCYDAVRSQKFLLDSLMSNWDRMNPYRQDT